MFEKRTTTQVKDGSPIIADKLFKKSWNGGHGLIF